MLIRELYQGAMALFYMQDILMSAQQTPYQWKLRMLFGEAASYIKQYDQIEDMETRGYIHRAMGNLALASSGLNHEDGLRKMTAIRRSLRFLNDPVYHEKSPGLPWELYIYKSHQERTTALGLLRAGENDPQVLREVMESAEYVMDQQREAARERGQTPALRWQYAYEAAQYHCGVRPLSYLLGWMEQVYMERDERDYSPEGIYRNMFLPALYAAYFEGDPEHRAKKKEIMGLMYRRMTKYVRRMPDNQLSESTQKNLLACLNSFVEYPDGILEKDFILELVACRNPDGYVSSRMAAEIGVMLTDLALVRWQGPWAAGTARRPLPAGRSCAPLSTRAVCCTMWGSCPFSTLCGALAAAGWKRKRRCTSAMCTPERSCCLRASLPGPTAGRRWGITGSTTAAAATLRSIAGRRTPTPCSPT